MYQQTWVPQVRGPHRQVPVCGAEVSILRPAIAQNRIGRIHREIVS
jgi:hypothetical protein